MSFRGFWETCTQAVKDTFTYEEQTALMTDTMRAMHASSKLWLKACFFRYENRDNPGFEAVTINGSACALNAAEFWKRGIIQDLRSLLKSELDSSVNASLAQVRASINDYVENNPAPHGWENLSENLGIPFYGRNVRCRVDRMLPFSMSYVDLYTFIDRFFFLLPNANMFAPFVTMPTELAMVVQNGPPPNSSAIHRMFIEQSYNIDGLVIDATNSTLCVIQEPGMTAMAVANRPGTSVHVMQILDDTRFRKLMFSRVFTRFFSWDGNPTNVPVRVFRQLVAAYVMGIADSEGGVLYQHVRQNEENIWECSVGVSLENGADVSVTGATGSVREDPWLILGSNVSSNIDTRVVTWDEIPRFIIQQQLPLHDLLQHFLCETFVASPVLSIDTAYSALYQDSPDMDPAVPILELVALWNTLCSMYDHRPGRFKQNILTLAMKNRPSIGQMMAQVVAKDPVAFDKALGVFTSGQTAYGGAGGAFRSFSSAVPTRTYEKLRTAASRKMPSSSLSSLQGYVLSRKWERS